MYTVRETLHAISWHIPLLLTGKQACHAGDIHYVRVNQLTNGINPPDFGLQTVDTECLVADAFSWAAE